MRKTLLFILINFLLLTNIYAYEWFTPLTKQEMNRQAAYIGITVIDWMQTKEFRAQGVKESNPVLGEEPSQEKIDLYIGSAIIAHTFVTWMLPHEFRPVWTKGFFSIEVVAVAWNYSHGYGPKIVTEINLLY
jgi:hypothetical protein